MGKSTLQIPRVCPQCGCTFLAKTVKTVYCCAECNWTARNEMRKRERKEKVLDTIKATGTEYVSITKALEIFTTSRNTIHRLIKSKRIHCSIISPKRILICVKDLEALFPLLPESLVKANAKQSHIFDMHPDHCYTIGEISQRFQITECSVYKHIRQFSIPTRQIGRFVYAPKKEIDKLYSTKKSKK